MVPAGGIRDPLGTCSSLKVKFLLLLWRFLMLPDAEVHRGIGECVLCMRLYNLDFMAHPCTLCANV